MREGFSGVFKRFPDVHFGDARHFVSGDRGLSEWLFTGTTASPKAVPHPYRTMLGNSRSGAQEKKLTAQSRVLCAAPLSHLYGLYSLHCACAKPMPA